MDIQKGFSLIEVVLSLALVSFVAFSFVLFQGKMTFLLKQSLLQSEALILLDKADDALLNNTDEVLCELPFKVVRQRTDQSLILSLSHEYTDVFWTRAYSTKGMH